MLRTSLRGRINRLSQTIQHLFGVVPSPTQTIERYNVVYVSMTGFRPRGIAQLPTFWWRTIRSFKQAQRAPGNLATAARIVDGLYHTMTVWSDAASVRAFVANGAHLKAMKNFRKLRSGSTYGYTCDEIPTWDTVYDLWQRYGREV
jgi:hypothetical protein